MSNFYDDESAAEHAELIAKFKAAKRAMREATQELTALQKSEDDTENISNDAYGVIAYMVRELNKDYDIESMLK